MLQQSSWDQVISEAYREATERWGRYNPAVSGGAQFWELEMDLDDRVLDDASLAIAQLVRDRRTAYETSCAVFFLHTLRTKLVHVRSNRLWPEFANVLSHHGPPVDGDAVAATFRPILDRVYAKRLSHITHHHRYVMFALDEAGVGWNRSAIVGDFLELLLDTWLTGGRDRSPEEMVNEAIGRLMRSSDERSDITALSRVIRRSGLGLLVLAREIQTSGRGPELALMDWPDLTRHLLERTGVDLDRIIPEARQALGRMVPRLGRQMTREALASLLADGALRVTFPAGVDPARSLDPLPLMPVRLHSGVFSRDVVVTDDHGLWPDAVLARDPDAWHAVGNGGVFIWRPMPFSVRTGPWTQERSIPLFSGTSADASRPSGHFWSGSIANGPHVDGVPDPLAEPRLRTGWRMAADGLRLDILECQLSVAYTGPVRILADGAMIWQGESLRGRLQLGEGPASTHRWAERSRRVTLAVTDRTGSELLTTGVDNLAENGCILSVGGRAYGPGHDDIISVPTDSTTRDVPLDRAILIAVREGGPEPLAEGAVLERATLPDTEGGFRLWSVIPHADQFAVTAGLHRWVLARRPLLRLESAAPAVLERHGLMVMGPGVFPVAIDDELPLSLGGMGDWPGAEAVLRDTHLRVATSARVYRWPLADILRNSGTTSGSIVEMDLRIAALRFGTPLPPGPIEASLSGPGQEPSPVTFYVLPWRSWRVAPSRRGDPSRLHLAGEDDTDGAILEGRPSGDGMMEARLRMTHGELRLRWHPALRDAEFAPARGKPAGTAMTLRDLEADARLRIEGGREWTARWGDHSVHLDPDGPIDISRVLLEPSGAAGPGTLRVMDGDELVRLWEVDASPIPESLTALWSEDGLAVSVAWVGLESQALEIHVIAPDLGELVPPSSVPSGGTPGAVSRRWKVVLRPPSGIAVRGHVIRVELRLERCTLRGIEVTPPPVVESPERIKRDILELLESINDATSSTSAARHVLALAERYAALTGSMPFRLDGMVQRLNGADDLPVHSLMLLDSLVSGDRARSPDLDMHGTGSDTLFWLTLALIHEMRLETAGEARPERFVRIGERLAGIRGGLADDTLRAWGASMEVVAARHEGRISPVTPGTFPAQAFLPLVSFDPSLARELSELASMEGSG